MIKGKPFVKWAGGKRQIIDKLKAFVPDEFDTYYEPFVGGGALLFELSSKKARQKMFTMIEHMKIMKEKKIVYI